MKAFRFGILLLSALMLLAITSCKKDNTFVAFTLISPASNSTNVPANQTFTCSTVSGALTYTFAFTNSGNVTTTATSSVPSTTVSFLNAGETYTWQVKAAMPDGSVQTSNIWSFTMGTSGNGGTPIPQSPVNNATGVCTTPTLTWTGSASGSYDLQVALDNNFSSMVHTATVTGTSYTMPAGLLHASGGYSWRVAVAGTSNFNGYSGFQTVGPPTMMAPADNSTTTSTSVQFSWSSIPCATSYDIQLSEYSDFHSIATTQTFSTTTGTLTQLSSNTWYYWHVKVHGDLYYGIDYGMFKTP